MAEPFQFAMVNVPVQAIALLSPKCSLLAPLPRSKTPEPASVKVPRVSLKPLESNVAFASVIGVASLSRSAAPNCRMPEFTVTPAGALRLPRMSSVPAWTVVVPL